MSTRIEWTPYLAVAYVERFCEGENATPRQTLEAWAYLIKTRLAYSLQGWYGRQAENLIANNIITASGELTEYAEQKLQSAGY